jgi:hypothetical protein
VDIAVDAGEENTGGSPAKLFGVGRYVGYRRAQHVGKPEVVKADDGDRMSTVLGDT